MTTLAVAFALLPLSPGIGAGVPMQQSFAIAVIGGLLYLKHDSFFRLSHDLWVITVVAAFYVHFSIKLCSYAKIWNLKGCKPVKC